MPPEQSLTDAPSCCRPALFLCQSDGSLAILEVQGSTLASKAEWVQPKNQSQAVNMVLLAANGSPLYPRDAHLHLTWPHNNMTSAVVQDEVAAGEVAADRCHHYHAPKCFAHLWQKPSARA